MNIASWLLWGFVATVVLTSLMAGSQSLGLTRINIPYMLGTLITPDRDRAKVYGILLHFLNGWLFSLIYIALFHSLDATAWWIGAAVGLLHSAFVLTVALPVLPGIHPRMASETKGPTVVRQLEPPGFLGLNYGGRTPASMILAHLAFGIILGLFYTQA